MEVYLLDVGQGTGNVVALGNQEALIIDYGLRSGHNLLGLLDRLRITRIPILLVSHNHNDHVGGATAILDQFGDAIDQVWFLDDVRLKKTRFWTRLLELHAEGILPDQRWKRLEITASPVSIYRHNSTGLSLDVFAPNYAANLQAGNYPNKTSGIVAIKRGAHSIFFGGDATIDIWRSVHQTIGHPINCDVLSVPHHGGDICKGNLADLDWLYRYCIVPKSAVISVGTSNADGHPLPTVIDKLREINASILCTQLTKKCCTDLESARPGVIEPHSSSRSSTQKDQNKNGNSRNVACYGTVLVEIDADGVRLPRSQYHSNRISALIAKGVLNPLCRR